LVVVELEMENLMVQQELMEDHHLLDQYLPMEVVEGGLVDLDLLGRMVDLVVLLQQLMLEHSLVDLATLQLHIIHHKEIQLEPLKLMHQLIEITAEAAVPVAQEIMDPDLHHIQQRKEVTAVEEFKY